MILGTQFLNLLKSFKVDDKRITINVPGQDLKIKFITKEYFKDLNLVALNQITRKNDHPGFLKEEVNFKRIETQFQNPSLIQKPQDYKNKVN